MGGFAVVARSGAAAGGVARLAFSRRQNYDSHMTTLTCHIPDSLAVRLEAFAEKEHRSKSAVLREALEAKLQDSHKQVGVKAGALVKHLRGCIEGAPSDFSVNPKYLEGFGE